MCTVSYIQGSSRAGGAHCSRQDLRWLYDAVEKPPTAVAFDDLFAQVCDMARAAPDAGITLAQLRACGLGAGVLNLLLNHNDLLLRRTTAEFSAKGLEVPL